MKNINMTINSNAITSIAPSTYAPPQAPAMPTTIAPKQTYSISFSAQFENEVECLKFATVLLNMTTGDAE